MSLKERYEKAKGNLLKDTSICRENRKLFEEFLKFEEYKLKRVNGRPSLDDNSYKTLLAYATRLRVVNRWFRYKSWRALTKADIQRVYDDLEDGRIKTRDGRPLKDKRTYYKLIIRSKPFEMAGKKELVKEVMQFTPSQSPDEVRFIREESFRKMVELTSKIEHRTFLWLCWDVGENAASILKLRKQDCARQINEHTGEAEYLVNLRKEILKRSRRPRSELTNYKETVHYLDLHLQTLDGDDLLFDFGEGWGKKLLMRAAERAGVRCLPGGQRVTLKDLRSSMACDLLSKSWSRDEVNARLGHAPSSREIDRYINYLAIDRVQPKRKFQENRVGKLMMELSELRDREKLAANRLKRLQETNEAEIGRLHQSLDVHTRLARLTIERQLGQIGERQFRAKASELYQSLLHTEDPISTLLFLVVMASSLGLSEC